MNKVTEIKSEITGWGLLDIDNPALGAIREQQGKHIKEQASDFRELFLDSELGLRVLQTLMGWTIKRANINPQGTERMDMFHAGQDDIVRCILAAIHNSEES